MNIRNNQGAKNMEKSIWNTLSERVKLSGATYVDGGRRVIKGLPGLAQIAAAPIGIGGRVRLLTDFEQLDFIRRVESGQNIEGMTFYLDGPTQFLHLGSAVVKSCKFITSPGYTGEEWTYPEFIK